jgi:hypothetical protein
MPLLAVTLAAAQAPPAQEAPRPDSAEVRRMLDAVKARAGTDWAEAFEFICAANATRANRPDDPEIEPTKVFDNLYVVGRTSTATSPSRR